MVTIGVIEFRVLAVVAVVVIVVAVIRGAKEERKCHRGSVGMYVCVCVSVCVCMCVRTYLYVHVFHADVIDATIN